MKHRDIDFHIYTDPFRLADSFKALARLAEDKHIKQITYCNFLEEKDTCVQWQAIYEDEEGERWQIDMVHIIKGSYYDGYFERMADGIKSVLTAETRNAILQLKQDTPENEHDDPKVTESDKLRADVCLTLPKTPEPKGEIGVKQIDGGKYAVYSYQGSYENLGMVYDTIYGKYLPERGYQLASRPGYEVYLSDPECTVPDKLRTEIYVPIL